jgi:PAS domain-containing protein
MEASPLGIVVIDPSRKILLFNQKFAEMWEIPPADLSNATLESTLLRSKRLLPDPSQFVARVDYLFDHPGEEQPGGIFADRWQNC